MENTINTSRAKILINDKDALFAAIRQALKTSDVVSIVRCGKSEVFVVPGSPPEDEDDLEY